MLVSGFNACKQSWRTRIKFSAKFVTPGLNVGIHPIHSGARTNDIWRALLDEKMELELRLAVRLVTNLQHEEVVLEERLPIFVEVPSPVEAAVSDT